MPTASTVNREWSTASHINWNPRRLQGMGLLPLFSLRYVPFILSRCNLLEISRFFVWYMS